MKKANQKTYTIRGKQLHCAHCGGADFTRGTAQLNTAGMSFMGLDFLNNSADTFICTGCGRIEWFFNPKVDLGAKLPRGGAHSGASVCLQCRKHLPSGVGQCPHCDWTYISPLPPPD